MLLAVPGVELEGRIGNPFLEHLERSEVYPAIQVTPALEDLLQTVAVFVVAPKAGGDESKTAFFVQQEN